MSKDRIARRGPRPADIARFEEASRWIEDPADEKQWKRWSRAAETLTNKGWRPAQVIEKLWEVRPEFNTGGLTPKQAEEALIRQQQMMEGISGTKAFPTKPELEADAAIIQYAVNTGQVVVVRGDVSSPEQLPSNIPQASFKRPFYLDPTVLGGFLVAQGRAKRP